MKAELYVELDDPEEGPAVLRSRSFRLRGGTPDADHDDVREAYEHVVARFDELGWEQVGRLSPWYAQRFRKREDHLLAVGGDGGGSVRDLRKEAP